MSNGPGTVAIVRGGGGAYRWTRALAAGVVALLLLAVALLLIDLAGGYVDPSDGLSAVAIALLVAGALA